MTKVELKDGTELQKYDQAELLDGTEVWCSHVEQGYSGTTLRENTQPVLLRVRTVAPPVGYPSTYIRREYDLIEGKPGRSGILYDWQYHCFRTKMDAILYYNYCLDIALSRIDEKLAKMQKRRENMNKHRVPLTAVDEVIKVKAPKNIDTIVI